MPPLTDPQFYESFKVFYTNVTKKKDTKRNLMLTFKAEAFILIIEGQCECATTQLYRYIDPNIMANSHQ